MFKSLRARLFISHLAVIVLVFLITAVVAFVPLRRAQNALEVGRLEAVANPLALQTSLLALHINRPNSDRTTYYRLMTELLSAQAQQLGARVILFDRSGQTIYDTAPNKTFNKPTQRVIHSNIVSLASLESDAIDQQKPSTTLPMRNIGVRDNQRIFLTAVPRVPDRVLALVVPVSRWQILKVLLPLALAAIAGMLGALLATAFLSRSIARPITQLTRAADAVTAGNLNRRVAGEGDDEVGRLIQSFNTMVARLQTTYESQRRLLANVAHELRTPLTSIQGYADALNDDIIVDEAGRREALTTISEESERINGLVVQILQLARLESRQSQPHPLLVDLDSIAETIIRRHRVEADQAGISLISETKGEIEIIADEALIDQAIDNLVRNSLRHTPAGGQVSIKAVQFSAGNPAARRVRISVSDTGEGIPEHELPYIFDRFRRAEANGATDGSHAVGFGLGLAIVHEIVAGHGGTIEVTSTLGKGSTFTIELPAGDVSASQRERAFVR